MAVFSEGEKSMDKDFFLLLCFHLIDEALMKINMEITRIFFFAVNLNDLQLIKKKIRE